MATITGGNLTLTPSGTNVIIKVQYTATITPFERALQGLGLVLREQIQVLGIDPPGAFTGTVLHTFPAFNLPTSGSLSVTRIVSITRSRASLQEDSGFLDADEIRCRITVSPLNLPVATTGFTDQEVLLG